MARARPKKLRVRRTPVFRKRPRPLLSAAVATLAVGALAVLLIPPSDLDATEEDAAATYGNCMTLARSEPKKAYDTALAWRNRNGGDAARHCEAVALLGLGQYDQSAFQLEQLAARTADTKPKLSLKLHGQAANAWLIAGHPHAAFLVQSRALKMRPNDVNLLIDRSIALASSAKYWEAIDDLNRAIDIAPSRVDALIFRASAYRRLETLELAAEDVTRALDMAPGNIDGLLERGIIRRLRGDTDGARADWNEVLKLAPDSAAAEFARVNLERSAIATPKVRLPGEKEPTEADAAAAMPAKAVPVSITPPIRKPSLR